VNLYAESSAVLTWLLVESHASGIYPLLTQSDLIISSELTLLECDRALIRALSLGKLNQTDLTDKRAELEEMAEQWSILPIGKDVVERARRPFPSEPIRSLDAIHLASALGAHTAIPDLQILSLDRRIRNAARQLGFKVLPNSA
jgi:predicted nucleic acid-binding protein